MGYVRVAFSALDVESQCAWALVQSYTAPELNNKVHCHEGGDNCGGSGPSSDEKKCGHHDTCTHTDHVSFMSTWCPLHIDTHHIQLFGCHRHPTST